MSQKRAEVLEVAKGHRMRLLAQINPEEKANQRVAVVSDDNVYVTSCGGGCGEPIMAHLPRVPGPVLQMCPDCAKARIEAAEAEGHSVNVVLRPTHTATLNLHHNDGTITKVTKEKRMNIDLDTITDAELGALVRARMIAQREARVIAENPVAKQTKKKAEKADQKARKAEQTKRQASAPLPEIVVNKSVTVPALDLSEVTSLNDVVDATTRSPFNKAVYHLKLQEHLPAEMLTDSGALKPEVVTYGVLQALHPLIVAAVEERKMRKTQQKVTKGEKIARLMAAFDIDEKAAKKKLKELQAIKG